MKNSNEKRKQMINRMLSVLCALVLGSVLCFPQVAPATPASSKMAEAEAVKTQIDAINARLDTASDNYYTAQQKLNQARSEQQANQSKLNKTTARLRVVQGHLNDRASSMYRSGPTGFAEVLFGATDFQQFANLWNFLSQQNQQDASTSIELKTLRAEATALQTKLNANTKQALISADQMAQIKQGVEQDLATRQSKLSGLESEIAALQAQDNAASAQYVGGGGNFPTPTYPANATVVDIARAYLGRPYVWAASGPNAFDCSGFTMFVYGKVGVAVPHSSRALSGCGSRVSRSDLQPGDLVFVG